MVYFLWKIVNSIFQNWILVQKACFLNSTNSQFLPKLILIKLLKD